MKILVVNTGSTSIKLGVVEIKNQMSNSLGAKRYEANDISPDILLKQFLAGHERLDATVHRVVHGGSDMVDSCLIDEATENSIDALSKLAPLHNPLALRWIRSCRKQLNTPQVSVFDTAFFDTMPAVAKCYAVPQTVTEKFGIRRYGFHGIAHRAMWRRWCELRPDLREGGKLITIHLGGGCSITATRNGSPQDTSMGFTPMEGLVMSTRCGDIDPGAIFHLMRDKHMTSKTIEKLLNDQSGLIGLSGKSADIRDLIDDSDTDAQFAIEIYCYRLRKYIGAYQAVLAGADGIVFGGGVGEHISVVRDRVLRDMQWCGIILDNSANQEANGGEAQICAYDSRVDVRVLPVDEATVLADEAYRILNRKKRKSI